MCRILDGIGAVLFYLGGIFTIIMVILTGWSLYSQAGVATVAVGIAMIVVLISAKKGSSGLNTAASMSSTGTNSGERKLYLPLR